MKHVVKITVLKRCCFDDLQTDYLANPESGPCPCFEEGQVYTFERTPDNDSFYKLGRGTLEGGGDFPCGEAWDCISRYVYTGLQGGSFMHGWTRDERLMIACCNDGTRPVIFKLERVDEPENEEERVWLAAQDFANSADDAYTG